MKLLHVISSLEIGGAQRLLSDLLPIQKEQGIDVNLLVYENIDNAFTKKVKSASIPIISLEEKNYRNPKILWKIRRVIRDYDIVHVHLFPSLYWVALASIGLPNVKLVWTEHSTNNRRRRKWYIRPIEKWMYRHYDRVISISEQTQSSLQDWLQSANQHFVTIYNGVDTQSFSNVHKRIVPNSLIMISRFVPAKDQETVIKAMTYLDKDVTLRFVGDGETLHQCKNLAKELGVLDRIEFMGARANVEDLIAESYIGIQSSHWEGFGLTAIEMMSAGKPVVASNAEGLRQIVEGAGDIFEVGNAKQLAEIVYHLLTNSTYYTNAAKRCRERAMQYDIHTMAEHYKAQYECISLYA